ncbi:MAG: hypothetical protein GY832_06560 [Chloroflexi bacterium]|nr:hypothetical protein [Chloroflexota bacterium]
MRNHRASLNSFAGTPAPLFDSLSLVRKADGRHAANAPDPYDVVQCVRPSDLQEYRRKYAYYQGTPQLPSETGKYIYDQCNSLSAPSPLPITESELTDLIPLSLFHDVYLNLRPGRLRYELLAAESVATWFHGRSSAYRAGDTDPASGSLTTSALTPEMVEARTALSTARDVYAALFDGCSSEEQDLHEHVRTLVDAITKTWLVSATPVGEKLKEHKTSIENAVTGMKDRPKQHLASRTQYLMILTAAMSNPANAKEVLSGAVMSVPCVAVIKNAEEHKKASDESFHTASYCVNMGANGPARLVGLMGDELHLSHVNLLNLISRARQDLSQQIEIIQQARPEEQDLPEPISSKTTVASKLLGVGGKVNDTTSGLGWNLWTILDAAKDLKGAPTKIAAGATFAGVGLAVGIATTIKSAYDLWNTAKKSEKWAQTGIDLQYGQTMGRRGSPSIGAGGPTMIDVANIEKTKYETARKGHLVDVATGGAGIGLGILAAVAVAVTTMGLGVAIAGLAFTLASAGYLLYKYYKKYKLNKKNVTLIVDTYNKIHDGTAVENLNELEKEIYRSINDGEGWDPAPHPQGGGRIGEHIGSKLYTKMKNSKKKGFVDALTAAVFGSTDVATAARVDALIILKAKKPAINVVDPTYADPASLTPREKNKKMIITAINDLGKDVMEAT